MSRIRFVVFLRCARNCKNSGPQFLDPMLIGPRSVFQNAREQGRIGARVLRIRPAGHNLFGFDRNLDCVLEPAAAQLRAKLLPEFLFSVGTNTIQECNALR